MKGKKIRYIILLLSLFASASAYGQVEKDLLSAQMINQTGAIGDSIMARMKGKEKKPPFVVRLWNKFSSWRARAQVAGYDPGYVTYPKHPWLVDVETKMSITGQMMYLPNMVNDDYCRIVNTTGLSSRMGVGGYYRGWGLSFGPKLSNGSEFYFEFSSYGRAFGFDLKIDNQTNMYSTIEWMTNDLPSPSMGKHPGLTGPELVLLDLNTYYVFNNKKFSYASALSQTSWQTKSAGSLIAGMSYLATYTGYDSAFFLQLPFTNRFHADTFHVLSHNLLMGVGYAYNWVWGKGKWLLHASVLPMARWSFYRDVMVKPYGDLDTWPEEYSSNYRIKERELQENFHQRRWGFAAMMRLAFFWNITDRWALGLVSSYANFLDGRKDGIKLTTDDLKLYAYVGLRL